jgi:hypothetical protein
MADCDWEMSPCAACLLVDAIRSSTSMKRHLQPSMHASKAVVLLIKMALEIKWLSKMFMHRCSNDFYRKGTFSRADECHNVTCREGDPHSIVIPTLDRLHLLIDSKRPIDRLLGFAFFSNLEHGPKTVSFPPRVAVILAWRPYLF